MIKKLSVLAVCAILIAVPFPKAQACGKTGEDRVCQLKLGKSADEAGFDTVTFVKITGDSRCPSGAQCIWAGEASVVLKIGEAEKTIGFPETSIMSEGKTQVELLEVLPYPGLAESKGVVSTIKFKLSAAPASN